MKRKQFLLIMLQFIMCVCLQAQDWKEHAGRTVVETVGEKIGRASCRERSSVWVVPLDMSCKAE